MQVKWIELYLITEINIISLWFIYLGYQIHFSITTYKSVDVVIKLMVHSENNIS